MVSIASDDVMAGYFGNTEISKSALIETRMIYNPDHTFVLKFPAFFNAKVRGTWAIDGSALCLNFATRLPGQSNPYCSPAQAHKVGDTWTEKHEDGTHTLTLVQGTE